MILDPKRIWSSCSGGRTSMMMARLIQLAFPGETIPYVFANTGQEHPRTLEFVQECAEAWDMPIVWVEAVVHDGRIASTHRIVDFNSASRDGLPFEEVIQKYGIPSKAYPHCTRELKINPMRSYIKAIGLKDDMAAVGIRGDEPKRLGKDPSIIYPMSTVWPQTKQTVLDWWKQQPFDLNLEEREGNCLWCWQKSDAKHAQNLAANPEWYEFPAKMEAQYADIKAPDKPRTIFRGGRSTDELIIAVKE